MNEKHTIYAAIALGALLLAYSDLLGASRIPIYRDLLPFIYPYRSFLADHLAQGRLPLWNPYVHLGVPFLASLHASALYAPSLLLLVPFPLGFNLFLLAHYLLAAGGIALFLRDRGLAAAPTAVGAVVFTVGGYLASSLTNTAHLQTAVWIPWVLLAWNRYGRTRSGRSLLAAILLLAIQLCAGAPEVWMLTVGLLAVRSLAGESSGVRLRLELTVRLSGAVALAILLAAVQLVPTFEYVSESRRLAELDWAEVTYWSLEPVSLLQLLLPHSSALAGPADAGTIGTYLETTPPLVQSLYVGVFGLILAIVGAVTSRERLLWGGVALLTVLFALGPGSPVFELARTVAPMVVGRIRYPEKVLVLFHVAIAILAADGAAAVVEKRGGAIRLSIVAAVTFALVTGAVVVVGFVDPSRLSLMAAILTGRGDLPLPAFRLLAVDLAYKAERCFLLIGAWIALVALHQYSRLRPVLFAPLFVFILAVDLASAHRNLALSVTVQVLAEAAPIVDVETLRRDRARIFHYQREIGGAPVPGLVRRRPEIYTRTDLRAFAVDQWRSLFLDLGMVHRVGTLSGFDSIGDLVSLEQTIASLPLDRAIRLLGAYNVRALVGTEPLESSSIEDARAVPAGELRSYRVRNPLPAVFLVAELEVVPSDEAAFLLLTDPAFPRDRRAVVAEIPAGWENDGLLASDESAVVEDAGVDAITVRVRARRPRFLVLNERHFPGWVAERDGTHVEIYRTNAFVRGLVVPAGEHRIRLSYEPRSLWFGLVLSAVAASALLGVTAIQRRFTS